MNNHPELRKRTMNISVIEGSLYSCMVGFVQYFITPFAVFINMPDFMIGLLRSISSLVSALGFYLSIWLLQFEKSRKELIAKYVSYQAYIILFFILIPLIPFHQSILFIIAYSLFLLFGSAVSPIWTSLMKDVVIKNERGSYFGMRNKIAGLFEVISSLVAGFILTFFTNNPYLGFASIFIFGFIFRTLSSNLIRKHWDPNPKIMNNNNKKGFEFKLFFVNDKYLNNLILLGGGMLFATNIAGPFFAVFMLRDLHFTYLDFTVATIASTLATLVSQPYWGKLIDKYGTRAVIFSTSLLIPLIPLLWIPAIDLSYVILIQLFSGVVWAGFDLAVFNMLLKISPSNKTQFYSATYNGVSTLLTFSGMLVGSVIIFFLGNTQIGLLQGIQIIFLISGVTRFIVVAVALPRITKKMQVNSLQFFLKTVTIYPVKGVISEVEQGVMLTEHILISGSKLVFDPLGSIKRISKGFQASIKLLGSKE